MIDITSEFKPVTFSEEYARQYWDGPENLFVRGFTYLREGVSLANEGKYLLAVFGLGFWRSDIVIPGWLYIIAGLLSIPLLVLIGRWNLLRAGKSRQYFTTIQGSITQFQGHNMQVFTTMLMQGIAEKLGVNVENIMNKLKDK